MHRLVLFKGGDKLRLDIPKTPSMCHSRVSPVSDSPVVYPCDEYTTDNWVPEVGLTGAMPGFLATPRIQRN
ncbi:unnamed protein product [Rhizoctonia solani]|uniref:Uncharacterized protein n=1 Tax=Rhizoctonia solani TaxID=456999 RepID=A0A8H3HUJ3_9AGAM|nr:unnamed protein product [Rhizoctonia solani]